MEKRTELTKHKLPRLTSPLGPIRFPSFHPAQSSPSWAPLASSWVRLDFPPALRIVPFDLAWDVPLSAVVVDDEVEEVEEDEVDGRRRAAQDFVGGFTTGAGGGGGGAGELEAMGEEWLRVELVGGGGAGEDVVGGVDEDEAVGSEVKGVGVGVELVTAGDAGEVEEKGGLDKMGGGVGTTAEDVSVVESSGMLFPSSARPVDIDLTTSSPVCTSDEAASTVDGLSSSFVGAAVAICRPLDRSSVARSFAGGLGSTQSPTPRQNFSGMPPPLRLTRGWTDSTGAVDGSDGRHEAKSQGGGRGGKDALVPGGGSRTAILREKWGGERE